MVNKKKVSNKNKFKGNPRQITKKQYGLLKEHIEELGDLAGVVYCHNQKSYVGGNQRSEVFNGAKIDITEKYDKPTKSCTVALGFIEYKGEKYAYREVAYTKEQFDKACIVANSDGGSFDWDILANEWNEAKLEEWGLHTPGAEAKKEDTAEEDDYVIPDEVKTKIKQGDMITIGDHRLMCGDSTSDKDVAYLMNNEKADMVFTDPPYNIDYQGVKDKRAKIANDKMNDKDFIIFLYNSLNIDCETFYVCCSWQYSHLFRESLNKLKKPVKSFIVWNKVNPAQHLDRYFKQHEIILYHGKFGGEKTLRGDIWEVKRERNTVHPTMKPISLIGMALNDNPDKNLIIDPFLGSGSTMVAAHQLKRKCYGMELDPKYCQVIIDRMIALDSSLTIKVNGKKYTPKK